jgi:hypothetical protein
MIDRDPWELLELARKAAPFVLMALIMLGMVLIAFVELA